MAKRPLFGRYHIYDVCERSGLHEHCFSRDNSLMASWGMAAVQLFGFGNVNYRINTIYIEYANTVHNGDIVAVPTFADTDSIAYYNGLAGSHDYLRAFRCRSARCLLLPAATAAISRQASAATN